MYDSNEFIKAIKFINYQQGYFTKYTQIITSSQIQNESIYYMYALSVNYITQFRLIRQDTDAQIKPDFTGKNLLCCGYFSSVTYLCDFKI
jgi:hypothetical protein